MVESALETQLLKKGIAQGDIGNVLSELIKFTERTKIEFTTEIYHTSARYRRLEGEKVRGEITIQDYKREFNAITLSLLEIISSIDDLNPRFMKKADSKDELKAEIEALSEEFNRADEIRSTPSRLRTKIHLARKMAEKFGQRPELVWEFKGSSDPAIMCAIGRIVKIVPDIEALEVLESVVHNAQDNITKGFIVNALAELVYSGQLRIGDDERMYNMLEALGKEGNRVTLTNVERVKAALDYLTGRFRD